MALNDYNEIVEGWPDLALGERRIMLACLELETVRVITISKALSYTQGYVRNCLIKLRRAFGTRENASLLLRADRLMRAAKVESEIVGEATPCRRRN